MSMRSGYDWTPARTEQLTQLANERLTSTQIGRVLGVTRNAVIGRLRRIGVKLLGKPFWQPPEGVTPLPRREATPRLVMPAPALPEPPVIAVEAPLAVGVRLLSAGFYACRYPLWQDVAGPDYPVCGDRTEAITDPYCSKHADLCFTAQGRSRGTRAQGWNGGPKASSLRGFGGDEA